MLSPFKFAPPADQSAPRERGELAENLSSALEPLLIVAVGVMVLILALGVFLPLWGMASTAGEGGL